MSVIGERVRVNWVKQSLTSNENSSITNLSVTSDKKGNVYTTGYFEGDIDISHCHVSSENIAPFVTKQNREGEFIYIIVGKVSGSPCSNNNDLKTPDPKIIDQLSIVNRKLASQQSLAFAMGTSIILDDDTNSLYITGNFRGDLKFEGINTLQNSACGSMIYVIKLDSKTGVALWGNSSKVSPDEGGEILSQAINADSNGVYVTGSFAGSILFGSDTLKSDNRSVFLTKLSLRSGEFKWSNQSMGGAVVGYALAILSENCNQCHRNNTGNIFLTGIVNGLALFENISLGEEGRTNAFLVKANNKSGKWIAGTQTFSEGDPETISIAVGTGLDISNNNIFLTGSFEGIKKFGKDIFSTPITNSKDTTFISKLNLDLVWKKTVIGDIMPFTSGRPSFNTPTGIVIHQNHVYVAGIFAGSVKFGDIDRLISLPDHAVFLIRASTKDLKFDTAFQTTNLVASESSIVPPNQRIRSFVVISDPNQNNPSLFFSNNYLEYPFCRSSNLFCKFAAILAFIVKFLDP